MRAADSGPALAGSVLYVGDDDGYLYAIDITSTSPRWRYRAGGPVRSQILYADGVVYSRVLGAEVTISPALNPLFQPALA